MIRILFLGDIVGRIGRLAVAAVLPGLKERYLPDLIIANGENAAGGIGLESKTAEELLHLGIDVLTTGNHVWKHREFNSYLERKAHRVVRPINYPPGSPGSGWCVREIGERVAVVVINAIGRVFMSELADCPFRSIETLLGGEQLASLRQSRSVVIFVDAHGEATSEKIALGYFLDGRVSAVVGTHTHVQTADERILPGGTAFLSDAGMCGPVDSVIGMNAEAVVERFVTGLPVKFEVARGECVVSGVVVSVDEATGRASGVERIQLRHAACAR